MKTMLLANKLAIIYGAGGAVGRTITETFAREGAKVFLTGRTKAKVDLVAEQINAAKIKPTTYCSKNLAGIGQTIRCASEAKTAMEEPRILVQAYY
jgi:NADP-dependent 3-hydroxy acid dehydrogenase YdfG